MNRAVIRFGLVIWVLMVSCDRDSDLPFHEGGDLNKITDGLCIQFGDLVIINHEEIDYYDFSTHMIYLKEPHDFLQNYNWEIANTPFTVYAQGEKIYKGILFPGWSSSMAFGPYIDFPFYYPDYIIKICYRSNELFSAGNDTPDPRLDQRIIDALERCDQFHAGLSCSIDEIEYVPQGALSFTFTVTNHDTFNYYILSPERMGSGGFHYFTTGLNIWNETSGWFNHQDAVISPDPWDYWTNEWFDLIESEGQKTYHILYEAFDSIPSGQYNVNFEFPGLSHVDMEEIHQPGGRIWLGEIQAISTFNF